MDYTVTEKKAAQALGVSPSRISQLVRSKLLDAVTINGKVRISEESLVRYQEESKRPGRPRRTSYETASKHTLMNGDYEVADVVFDSALAQPLVIEQVLDPLRAPLGILTSGGLPKRRELNDWWLRRAVPGSRPGIESKLIDLGIESPSTLSAKSMGLSLSDCYWLRPVGAEGLRWSDVNFFDNDFDESSSDGWDSWLSGIGLSSPDNTSEGELPKKWVARNDGTRCLLKGCRSDDQRPYNEVAATALYERLLSPEDYVSYDTVITANGPACRCANFLVAREEYIPAIYVKELGGRIRAAGTYDRFCRTTASLGIDELSVRQAMSKMILTDAILANTDRHWRNFGFIRNIDTLQMRCAPLFDAGNSLWFSKTAHEVSRSERLFMLQPFGPAVADALACLDDLSWFDPSALDGFADQACSILSASEHASQPGRLDFIRRGIEDNIHTVRDAAEVLAARIARGR